MGTPTKVAPAYAKARVAAIDAQIKSHEAEIKRLRAKRTQFAKHLPAKSGE